MSKSDVDFKTALQGKRIAPLTVDKKYHNLVQTVGLGDALKSKEDELNELLKAQGKANTDIKDLKKLKMKLMQEIVDNADETNDKSANDREKKAEENSRLISECNDKIEEYEDQLLDFPKQIDDINTELMIELMENCYDLMKTNAAEIEEISKWITKIRVELKKKLVKKTDMETKNQEIYAFMHDIFGSEVIEIFDMKYKDASKNE